MSLPISDEKKKMGMQFLQQQQQQASQQQKQMMDFRKGLRKNLLDFAQQGNEFLPASELSRVEEEASRIFAETGDAYAAYQGAIKKMAEEEAEGCTKTWELLEKVLEETSAAGRDPSPDELLPADAPCRGLMLDNVGRVAAPVAIKETSTNAAPEVAPEAPARC